MMLPKDPNLLFSVINTKLRDKYSSLTELCEDLCEDEEKIKEVLARIGYNYSEELNKFI